MSGTKFIVSPDWFDLLVCSSGIAIGLILAPLVVATVNWFLWWLRLDVPFDISSSRISFGISRFPFREEWRSMQHFGLLDLFEIFSFLLTRAYGTAIEGVFQLARLVVFRLLSLKMLYKGRSWLKFFSSNVEM